MTPCGEIPYLMRLAYLPSMPRLVQAPLVRLSESLIAHGGDPMSQKYQVVK